MAHGSALLRVEDLRNLTNGSSICVLASLLFPLYSAVKYAGKGRGRKETGSESQSERETESEKA